LINKNLAPNGSSNASWSFSRLPLSSIHEKTSSGARPTLPMGVAPEAIVEKGIVSSIGSNILCLLLIIKSKLCMIISSGARSALPIVVAPEAVVEYFRV
jgi:hypothetical protein